MVARAIVGDAVVSAAVKRFGVAVPGTLANGCSGFISTPRFTAIGVLAVLYVSHGSAGNTDVSVGGIIGVRSG